MSTHRQIDRICAVVMAFAVVITILFMNGSRLGLKLSVDADAEAHSDDSHFTDNDLQADWDTSGAGEITLEGDSATVSGSGCYVYDGNVVIAKSGKYVVSGSLTGGSIVVDADDTSKVWILFDGVEIECEDDACLIVDQADKVFLTLAEGSENVLTSGDTYSEEALEDNTDGAIFAHDDLTINGSGSLSVTAGYKHGIAANDDMVITGGSITVSAAKDGIHANDSLRITDAVLNISAEDDGLTSDNEGSYIYIASGDITVECADEGICSAGDVTIDGGNITISVGTEQGHHAIKAAETCTVTDGTVLMESCYEGIQAKYIDIQGGDITIYPTDDGMNASSGSSTEDMFGMGGGGQMPGMTEMGQMPGMTEMGQMPGMTEMGQMPAMPGSADWETMTEAEESLADAEDMTEAEESLADAEDMTEEEAGTTQQTQGQMMPPGNTDSTAAETELEGSSANAEDMTEAENGTTQQMQGQMMPPGFQGQQGMPGMSDTDQTEMDSDSSAADYGETETESEEETPWLHISGGSILIVNDSGMDADGLDSNGDILISGGDVRVSLTDSGSNSAIDYASESGGVCEITGGTVIVCGSYAMAEGFSSESTQGSILYSVSAGAEEESLVMLEDESGNVLLTWTVPCAFSAVTFSCPEMTVGETYRIVINENAEEVTLTEIAISSGDAQSSMFGGTFNMGGGMQPMGNMQMQPQDGMESLQGQQPFPGMAGSETEADGTAWQGQQAFSDTAGSETEADGTIQQGQQPQESMMPQGPGMNQGEADTSESEDDEAASDQQTEEITTETKIIWGLSFFVLALGLVIAWRYRRY